MYLGIGYRPDRIRWLLTRFFWNTGAHGRQKWGVFYFEVAQRSIVFSLAVVIIAIIFVLSKYPLHLGRNTYVSCAFFSVLFLSEAVQLFVDAMMRELYNRYVDWTASACHRALPRELGSSAAAGTRPRLSESLSLPVRRKTGCSSS